MGLATVANRGVLHMLWRGVPFRRGEEECTSAVTNSATGDCRAGSPSCAIDERGALCCTTRCLGPCLISSMATLGVLAAQPVHSAPPCSIRSDGAGGGVAVSKSLACYRAVICLYVLTSGCSVAAMSALHGARPVVGSNSALLAVPCQGPRSACVKVLPQVIHLFCK